MRVEEKRMDDRMHEVLRSVGPGLEEPTVSAEMRARLEGIVSAAGVAGGPRVVMGRIGAWRRAMTWGLAAAAVLLLVTSIVSMREVVRLRNALAAAGGSGGGDGVVLPASVPGLMMVNFHHDQCPVARTVTPEFHQMAARYQGKPILFVTLDLTDWVEAKELAQYLGLNFLFEHPESIRTGMVDLVDTKRHEVLASSVGVTELPRVEVAVEQRIAMGGRR